MQLQHKKGRHPTFLHFRTLVVSTTPTANRSGTYVFCLDFQYFGDKIFVAYGRNWLRALHEKTVLSGHCKGDLFLRETD